MRGIAQAGCSSTASSEVGLGFLQAARFLIGAPEARVGECVALGHGDGALEERRRIAPVADLEEGDGRERRQGG